MSDWETKRFPPRVPKRPPPEHGIKIKKAGTTWWGQRWVGALRDVLRGQPGRLERGATYARAGRTHDLRVTRGKVVALVTGSRQTPYEVSFELRPIPASTWDAAIAEMAKKAQFCAELLASEMPLAIDEVFLPLGVSLFPRQRAELTTSCTCPDWGDPCKHVAATHYVLGEALDRDPFLLFELRGRTKDEVLAALRSARALPNLPPTEKAPNEVTEPVDAEIPHVTLSNVSARDYDKPRAKLPTLHFAFDEPEEHGAVLRQLGAPRTWNREQSPADLLAPIVQRAAQNARLLALSEPAARLPSADAPKKPGSRAKKSKRR